MPENCRRDEGDDVAFEISCDFAIIKSAASVPAISVYGW